MITADTITDEQIHRLRKELLAERRDPKHPSFDRAHGLFGLGADVAACFDANNGHVPEDTCWRRDARARCAEILNARTEVK